MTALLLALCLASGDNPPPRPAPPPKQQPKCHKEKARQCIYSYDANGRRSDTCTWVECEVEACE
jgi:hypothetical protein